MAEAKHTKQKQQADVMTGTLHYITDVSYRNRQVFHLKLTNTVTNVALKLTLRDIKQILECLFCVFVWVDVQSKKRVHRKDIRLSNEEFLSLHIFLLLTVKGTV